MAAVIESAQDLRSRLHQHIQNHNISSALSSWLGKIVYSGNRGSVYSFHFTQAGLRHLFPNTLLEELTGAVRDICGDYSATITLESEPAFVALSPLSDKSFNNFHTNSENRLALAACRAICKEDRLLSYNPLFIHGGTGLGKTHLLNAIANEYRSVYPERVIRFFNSDIFLSQFFSAVRDDRLSEWRELNSSASLFLIDDIQLLASNANAVNEFYHLFDVLHANKSQIVISSSLAPRRIVGMPDNLLSRFQWGLTIEIQKTEVSTRESIIRERVQNAGFTINDALVAQIAQGNSGNIRELEGSVNTICSHAALLQREIDRNLIDSVIRNECSQPQIHGSLMAADFVDIIADFFRVRREALLSKTRIRSVAYPRQVGMYLAKTMTGSSLEEIGSIFGGRDHSTVKHGIEKVKEMAESDQSVKNMLDQLRERVLSLTTA